MLDDSELWDVNDEVYNAIRAAELAAEGAALRARAWAALLHWAALVLLGASLLLGIAMLTLPILRPWYGQAVWVFVLGFGCYLLVVAIVYWSRPTPRAPEVRELLRLRRRIAALHVELQRTPSRRRNAALVRILSDAIRLLDDNLIPALQELIERRTNLQRELRRYERGEILAPSPRMLRRLQGMLRRLQAGIDECLQQAANAYATLIALLQMGNDEEVANQARAWAEDLTTIHDTLVDVLDQTDDRADEGAEADRTEPEPGDAAVAEADGGEPDPAEPERTPERRAHDVDPVFVRQVEDALRCARDMRRLTDCELIDHLPCTIEAALRERRNGQVGDSTSLERAEALRAILIAAVDRLRPADMSPSDQSIAALHYRVLHHLYVEGRATAQVAQMVSASPRTLFRWRSDAVLVLARDLYEREARCGRGGADAPPTN